MTSSKPYRRHSDRFKLQICQDIRSGARTRAATMQEFKLSSALLHQWLAKFDSGQLDTRIDDVSVSNHAEAKIAALERKVGQLTMELELLRMVPQARQVGAAGDAYPSVGVDARAGKGSEG